MLGLVQVVLIPIPFVFYKYGDRIRARSPLIKQMREDAERIRKRAAAGERRGQRKEDAEKGTSEEATETNMGDERSKGPAATVETEKI